MFFFVRRIFARFLSDTQLFILSGRGLFCRTLWKHLFSDHRRVGCAISIQEKCNVKPVRLVLFLMILASICTLLLSTANFAFEKASEVFNIRLYAVILELFEIPASEDEVSVVFEKNFEIQNLGGRNYYVSTRANPGTVVFKNDGPGLWSTIEILLAVNPDFESLYGFRVLAQAETPGLGGRISEMEFQDRFRDVEIRPELRIVKFASGANEVDSISGASKTGEALERLINSSVRELDSAFGREGG